MSAHARRYAISREITLTHEEDIERTRELLQA